MKFDVIIGNPPYQLGDGGNNASATPIYNLFVEQAKKLNPTFLTMIIPARWYAGGRGLKTFRENMLKDCGLKEIHDFKSTSDCFPGIRVGGGICYFLLDSKYNSKLITVKTHVQDKIVKSAVRKKIESGLTIFIRDSIAAKVVQKISNFNERKMSEIVFSQKPFGLRTNFMDFSSEGELKLYTKKATTGVAYISKEKILKNSDHISKWKVITSRSTSVPEEDNGQVLRMSQTFIAEPNAVVTESYVVIGSFDTKNEALNCMSYVKTKFLRFLCQLTIVSPDVSSRTFDLVPLLGFNKQWTDKKLYNKYSLNKEEIEHIESIIKAVE